MERKLAYYVTIGYREFKFYRNSEALIFAESAFLSMTESCNISIELRWDEPETPEPEETTEE